MIVSFYDGITKNKLFKQFATFKRVFTYISFALEPDAHSEKDAMTDSAEYLMIPPIPPF